jgi:hypothetical protein
MLSQLSRVLPVLGLLAAGVPLQAAPPTYPCYQPTLTPVPDGEIADDPAWQSIPTVTGFSVLGGTYTVPKQTFAQACWDDGALYVALTCEEPDAAQLKPTVPNGGPAWLDDGVEIFVQPAGGAQVFQFVITAGGARGSGDVFPDLGQVEVGTKIGSDAYWVEARIPFAVLGATPQVGDRWRGSFCRNTWTTQSGGDRFTSWPPLKQRFLEPESFATLVFCGPAPDAATAVEVGNDLNHAYRADLVTRLQGAAAQEAEYADALREAARDAEFGRRARTLRRRWREIDSALRDASRVPITDLRRTVGGADSLVQDSYDLKYAYLIALLLRKY